MRIYIAGKITGDPDYKAKFTQREKELRYMGYFVYNPAFEAEEFAKTLSHTPTHEEYMNFLIPHLCECDGISMLDGWEESAGAKTEYAVAAATGKHFVKCKILRKL